MTLFFIISLLLDLLFGGWISYLRVYPLGFVYLFVGQLVFSLFR